MTNTLRRRFFVGSGCFWHARALFLLLLATTATTTANKHENTTDDSKCGLYLATSTIPNAGLGVFLGHKTVGPHEYLLEDDGDVAVPWQWEHSDAHPREYYFVWWDYFWNAWSQQGMAHEAKNGRVEISVASPGHGSLANSLLTLANIVDSPPDRRVGLSGLVEHDGQLPSLDSPGAGAFTPYHNRRWKSNRKIVPGAELFVNYGQNYFHQRYPEVPLKANFRHIDRLLSRIVDRNAQPRENLNLTRPQQSDLLAVLQAMPEVWGQTRNTSAIPTTEPPGDVDAILWLIDSPGHGSGWGGYNASLQSLEWLEEHGRCLDNLKDGTSAIPDAGRGAFARRDIAAGQIVAPMPVIQVTDRRIFEIYDPDGRVVHHQLLLNYCFGHADSDVLLCPYGIQTSAINHDPHRNPNARLVWAADHHMAHPEWRDQPVSAWEAAVETGLSLDVIALRDIAEGEEVTIDYGTAWDAAWRAHVKEHHNRRTKSNSKQHLPAYEWNALDATVPWPLSTSNDALEATGDLEVFCFAEHLTPPAGPPPPSTPQPQPTDWTGRPVRPCQIVDRQKANGGSYAYTVELLGEKDPPHQRYTHLPREALWARNKPYTALHQQRRGFRHEARLPDEIFPAAWKRSNNNHESTTNASKITTPEEEEEEDPLFRLPTSGDLLSDARGNGRARRCRKCPRDA